MLGEQVVQLAHPLAVAGNSDISKLIICLEFDPGDRLDTGFPASLYKIGYPGGVIDIGQGKGGHPGFQGLFHQVVYRERSIAEAEVGMAV